MAPSYAAALRNTSVLARRICANDRSVGRTQGCRQSIPCLVGVRALLACRQAEHLARIDQIWIFDLVLIGLVNLNIHKAVAKLRLGDGP